MNPTLTKMEPEEYKTLFASLDLAIQSRSDALYSGDVKRSLPETIPTKKNFRDLRKELKTLLPLFVEEAQKLHPKKKRGKLAHLSDAMVAFLELPSAFEGWYTTILLFRALNRYISVRGLSHGMEITLDEALMNAFTITDALDGPIPRTMLMKLNSTAISETDKSAPAEIEALLDRESSLLDTIGDQCTQLKEIEKNLSLMEAEEFVEERELLSAEIETRKKSYHLTELASTDHFFSTLRGLE